MAANKFATLLHRNTNNITLILVYALLEWILILLLLFQAFFSYLIIKFADCFGLKRPCLWCSRVDHVFEPKKKQSYRDLLCEAHKIEISNLGYCSNHQNFNEFHDLCEDCSSSSLSKSDDGFYQISNNFPFFVDEKEDLRNCSCCGNGLKNGLFSPCIVIKPSWKDLDYSQKQDLIVEPDVHTDEIHDSDGTRSESVAYLPESVTGIMENSMVSGVEEAEKNSTCSVCGCGCKEMAASSHEDDDKAEMVVEKDGDFLELIADDLNSVKKTIEVGCSKEDASADTTPLHHLEFYIDRGNDRRLIPVDLIDFSTDDMQDRVKDEEQEDCGNQDVVLDFDMHFENEAQAVTEDWKVSREAVVDFLSLSPHESKEEKEPEIAEFGNMDVDEDPLKEEDVQVSISQATQTPSNDDYEEEFEELAVREGGELDSDLHQDFHMWNDELEAEISIGTEIPDHEPIDEIHQIQNDIPDHEPIDEIQTLDNIPDQEPIDEMQTLKDIHDHEPIDEIQTQNDIPSHPSIEEVPSTSSAVEIDNMHDSKEANEEVQFKILSVETSSQTSIPHKPSSLELNENEDEDKVPDTPTSMESIHQLHKKLLLLDRRESGTEESLDGSVVSDIDGGDGVLTIEKLTTTLRTERKALNALYAELEEERSASAIAANQTMAMINRLQEEKASMQMEALQYQRMMEEQSEYDQEALQLLNELVVKREKEKQELERDVEIYRKKLQEYETREKMALLRNRRDSSIISRNSSVSCSNADDSDGLSVDLNNEPKKEEDLFSNQESNNQNTPAEAVLYLEETLTNFEEERLSILEELKMLEEKLFTLSDEEHQFEDIKAIEHYSEQNGNGYHKDSDYATETNGFGNGHSKETNGKHYQERRTMSTKAKRLLPLFDDVVDADVEDGIANEDERGFDSITIQKSLDKKFDSEYRTIAVEEEVDHVYERLQALEADREFLKHCIGSLRKGDKGLDLLQEILQHLRDLRSVDVQLKNMGDGVVP